MCFLVDLKGCVYVGTGMLEWAYIEMWFTFGMQGD